MQSGELARRFEAAKFEPNRLRLIALDPSGAIVGVASTSDGGVLGGGGNRYRANVRVAPEHRGRGLGTRFLARLGVIAAMEFPEAVALREAKSLRLLGADRDLPVAP